MALIKRGKTWHTHFFVDGQRFRQSLETSDWRKAQAKEKELITQAIEGKLNSSRPSFAKLPFDDAAAEYFDGRKLELGKSSQSKERQLLVKPREFFRKKPLSKITPEDVIRFREWRSQTRVGPAIINMEVGVIRRMLKRAKRWHLVGGDLRPSTRYRAACKADARHRSVHIELAETTQVERAVQPVYGAIAASTGISSISAAESAPAIAAPLSVPPSTCSVPTISP